MHERVVEGDDKMDNDPPGNEIPSEDNDELVVDEEEENLEDFDFGNAEFSSLNAALDQLQGALDNLESRNAGIHEELLELLQSNREVRRGLREEREKSLNSATNNGQSESEVLPFENPSPSGASGVEAKTLFSNSISVDDSKCGDTREVESLPDLLQSVNVYDKGESHQSSPAPLN